MLTSLLIYLGVLGFLFLIRKAVGLFWTASSFFAGTLLYLMKGFDPPVPASVLGIYGATTLIALLLYVTSSESARESFFGPIRRILVEDDRRVMRWLLLLLVPGVIAWQGYQMALPSPSPPPKTRQAHPPPPDKIVYQTVGAEKPQEFDVIKGESPLRPLKASDPGAFDEKLALGRKVYFQNCYYCHGDTMAAEGHYAFAVRPPPASFQDAGTIAMLEESFIFWRVTTGGPGLPDGGTPWDSSMPAWHLMLSTDEIWSVILFLYEYTGYKPRAKESVEGH
jgi:mono/diheme cytochrome c family protein